MKAFSPEYASLVELPSLRELQITIYFNQMHGNYGCRYIVVSFDTPLMNWI